MNYKLYRTRRKKKWRGDLAETIGAYERLHLLELRARAVHINSRFSELSLDTSLQT